MTKEKFIICAAVAFLGSLVNFFVQTNKRSGLKNILDLVIGLSLLSLIICSFSPDILGINIDENAYFDYEKISDSVMEKVLTETCEKIKETISSELDAVFDIDNVKSDVSINKESFVIEKAVIYINDNGKSISNYKIKTYFKQKYDMDVEVLIC